MSVINEDVVNTGKYCSECKWERHQWACGKYSQCSHIKLRRPKNYSHRETDIERYPFGSNVNPYGNCTLWEPKPDIIKDIGMAWNEWWKGFKKGSWRE